MIAFPLLNPAKPFVRDAMAGIPRGTIITEATRRGGVRGGQWGVPGGDPASGDDRVEIDYLQVSP